MRPILHEPSPISMSRIVSEQGIPVSAGDQLRLRAVYDNHLPHTRVMSILMAYLVPGDVEPCAASPDDIEIQDVPRRFRKPYPPATVPLMAPPRGRVQALHAIRSAWATTSSRSGAWSWSAATTVTWDFDGDVDHDVAVANGPYAFSSEWIKKGEFTYTFSEARHVRPLLHAASWADVPGAQGRLAR